VLFRSLERHGFSVGQLHGDMPQSVRTETLDQFRRGDVKLLVCSDVAARGLDIADVSHVFNFDVPSHAEDYVHRIGRTGRAGREGGAFTIATPEDGRYVAAIQKLIGKEIPLVQIEGTEVLALEDGGDARGGRRGRGGSSRGGRGEAKPRQEPKPRNAPKREPAEAKVEAKAEAEPMPEPKAEATPEPRPVEPRSRNERSERPERAERDAKRGRRGRSHLPADDIGEMEHDDDVVAFGGHTPSFLLRDPFAK
jgi:superfamily II DNA/RNA helicase